MAPTVAEATADLHFPTPSRSQRTAPFACSNSAADAAETWLMVPPLLAATPFGRRSPDGGDNFPAARRLTVRLGGDLPRDPVTISIYAPDGTGRLLAGDFDIGKAQQAGAADPAALVAAEAADFAALIARCGGRAVHDISPSQGRHVYLKLRQAVAFEDLRRVAEALAERYTTFDAGPMRSPKGQIRVAGCPYKRQPRPDRQGGYARTGPLLGYMALTMPLGEAVDVLRRPCGPKVWDRLQRELSAELAVREPALSIAAPGPCHIDTDGQPWLPLRRGPRPLPPRLADLAVTGAWNDPRLQPDHKPYASPSEARFAVLRSLAAGGWRLAEVLTQMKPGGTWPGLDRLLGTRTCAQRAAVMQHDWSQAIRQSAAHQSARNSHTSFSYTPPGSGSGDRERWPIPRLVADTPVSSLQAYGELQTWTTAVWLAERDPIRCKAWGRRSLSARLVLRALGLACRLTGANTTAFGVRSLALMSGLSWRTVAQVLADLREEPDPLVDLVRRGVEADADVYALRIPDAYRAQATRYVWQAGRIETGHPAFLELGPVCALLYEALAAAAARPVDLERRAVLSSTAVDDALKVLGSYGLAERCPGGWRRGPATLDQVATQLDAHTRFTERVQEYRRHRAEWHAFLGIMGDPADWPTAAETAEALANDAAPAEEAATDPTRGLDPLPTELADSQSEPVSAGTTPTPLRDVHDRGDDALNAALGLILTELGGHVIGGPAP
ncbi:hypothetical protein GCM10010411_75720 [Actinomadura fulvescens]|uniref:DNA primase/polymerase bifunctional N-terminal domain-containing protein n=1 Tax=Actinomadura fulvescens TaxID=46160 RepID=A0ABP6CSL7_9ACTN